MIVEIFKDTSRLDDIKKLWRANAATLGFFPDGAFHESASKGCILVARERDKDKEIVGYLLFRKSSERLAIAHLCVRDNSRRSGVAKALFESLRSLSQPFRGITVSCRRDFTASSVWPKLGFVAIQEKRGRGSKDTILTNWWFDCGNPDLFSLSEQRSQEERISVVVDANVFYDFDKPAAPDTEESQALLADWLQAAITFYITPETLNEINRHRMASDRKKNRERTGQYSAVWHVQRVSQHMREKLGGIFYHLSLRVTPRTLGSWHGQLRPDISFSLRGMRSFLTYPLCCTENLE
jgi:GNAT superfamily N-acetyltransferase